MVETILKSVAAAIVLAALGASWRWGRGPLARMLARMRLDHETLYRGPWQVHLPPPGVSSGVQVRVLCAPSRALRESRFDVGKAIGFVEHQLGFAGHVAFTGVNEGIRVEKDIHPSGIDFAWVCRNGKIDLNVSLPITTTGDGRRILSVLRLLEPIASVYDGIQSRSYTQVHGVRPVRRRRRFDWLIGVSIESRQADFQSLPSWSELIFPAEAPPRAVTARPPFCPVGGFGTAMLRGSWRHQELDDVLHVFLSAFLAENGYHDFESAVDGAIQAFFDDRVAPSAKVGLAQR